VKDKAWRLIRSENTSLLEMDRENKQTDSIR